jgi:hypothetical protein
METKTAGATNDMETAKQETEHTRRRKRNASEPNENVRYFLPRDGSSSTKPELGKELTNEREALFEAFRTGQPFFALTLWKAVPDDQGNSSLIVKQPLPRN